MSRRTEEVIGLTLAAISLVATLMDAKEIATLTLVLLVLFFLFKASGGKDHIHRLRSRR